MSAKEGNTNRKSSIVKKINAIFKLMEYFAYENREISIYDKDILEKLECSTKTLERYLIEIENNYFHIIKIKKVQRNVWQMVKANEIFTLFIKNYEDISWLMALAKEADNRLFKDLQKESKRKLLSILKKEEEIFYFKYHSFEEIKDKNRFNDLKLAVKNSEYRDIEYEYEKVEFFKDVKCLKIIFSENNWYLAGVLSDDNFKFFRLSFIKNITKTSHKNFDKTKLIKQIEFISTFQNPMTRYNQPKKRAIIKVSSNIAIYFQKTNKPYLDSQKIEKVFEDGSMYISYEYTQALEILPLVKKWLPDMIVVEPKELREVFLNDLKKAISLTDKEKVN